MFFFLTLIVAFVRQIHKNKTKQKKKGIPYGNTVLQKKMFRKQQKHKNDRIAKNRKTEKATNKNVKM